MSKKGRCEICKHCVLEFHPNYEATLHFCELLNKTGRSIKDLCWDAEDVEDILIPNTRTCDDFADDELGG